MASMQIEQWSRSAADSDVEDDDVCRWPPDAAVAPRAIEDDAVGVRFVDDDVIWWSPDPAVTPRAIEDVRVVITNRNWGGCGSNLIPSLVSTITHSG